MPSLFPFVLAQNTAPGAVDTTAAMIQLVVQLVIAVIVIIAWWKVFTKAGAPGWAAIIPIYNIYILLKLAGRPGWWLILMLIPFVNIIIFLIVSIDVAKSFGKGMLFGLGLFFLSPIFYCILGFGSAEYQGPAAA